MANNSRAVATWQDFQTELRKREEDFGNMLPTHVSPQRLIASAVAAVKQNPALLKCETRSLFNAITKAAQDGLMPDGREGVITPYGNEAQWNPMAYGLRKRARELDGIIVNAQVVYANDTFEYEQGDEPRLRHVPAPLGKDRGKMIGAYAIFKNEKEGILHREIMDEEQVEKVRSQSKAQNSLMWTKFASEGWRKSVLRRGIKSVPCSPSLETIIRRDDEAFDFDETEIELKPGRRKAPREKPEVITPNKGGQRPLPPKVGAKKDEDVIDIDPDDDDTPTDEPENDAEDQEEDQPDDDAGGDKDRDEDNQGRDPEDPGPGDDDEGSVEELGPEKETQKPAAKKAATKKATKRATKKTAAKKAAKKPSAEEQAEAARSADEMFEEMENVFSGITAQEEFDEKRKYYLDHPALQFPPDKAEARKIISKHEEALTS